MKQQLGSLEALVLLSLTCAETLGGEEPAGFADIKIEFERFTRYRISDGALGCTIRRLEAKLFILGRVREAPGHKAMDYSLLPLGVAAVRQWRDIAGKMLRAVDWKRLDEKHPL